MAGVGRTGTMIGGYLIENYGMNPFHCMCWIRLCRPGSINALQQDYLVKLAGLNVYDNLKDRPNNILVARSNFEPRSPISMFSGSKNKRHSNTLKTGDNYKNSSIKSFNDLHSKSSKSINLVPFHQNMYQIHSYQEIQKNKPNNIMKASDNYYVKSIPELPKNNDKKIHNYRQVPYYLKNDQNFLKKPEEKNNLKNTYNFPKSYTGEAHNPRTETQHKPKQNNSKSLVFGTDNDKFENSKSDSEEIKEIDDVNCFLIFRLKNITIIITIETIPQK